MTDNVSPKELARDPEEQPAGNDSLSDPPETVPPPADDKKQLWGWNIMLILLLLTPFVGFSPAINLATRGWFRTWDLDRIGYDLLNYVKTNQRFPPAQTWCDAMLESGDKYHSYSRYTNHKEDFPYTLNRHVLGCKEVPYNMVVLFCGSPGWNQVGDYESVKNNDRVTVFLGNKDIRTYRKHQVPFLRWKVEDSGVIPAPGIAVWQVIFNVALAAAFMALMITGRRSLRIFWVFALGMGILSAAAGVFLGLLSEGAYYKL
ncbi:MAG: hypothetical protein JW810_01955, partial [Sedimentisphaerales bacterium]|nr:hypothetical protein [Sedimentisphaerales bacterium]